MTSITSGRRIAVRQRRAASGMLTALVLVLAAMLVVAAAFVGPDPDPAARTATVRVDRLTTACLPSDQGRPQHFTLAAPVAELGRGGSLSVRAADRPDEGRTLSTDRGLLQPVDVPSAGAVVEAQGETAAGRTAFGVARDGGSLAVQECPAPRARWWFTGGGAGLDHRSRLVLVNVDPGPAVLDVTVHGPDGVIDSVGTRGLTLGPGETLDLDLVELAPQTEELAVHVEASRGRVVAGLADELATDTSGRPGRDWVPAQADPARVLRLSPLPTRAQARTLVVGNPTDREALVAVEVSGEGGSFAPTEGAELRVPAGTVIATDLSAAVGRDPSAVLLRSRVPVTASVRSARAGDITYAAVVAPLHGPSAALLPDRADAAVHLTAGDTGGSADLAGYTADGSPAGETTLDVAPGATARWVPPGRAAYVVVTPSAGRIFGGVTLDGRGVAQVPLRTLPVDARRPVVMPVPR